MVSMLASSAIDRVSMLASSAIDMARKNSIFDCYNWTPKTNHKTLVHLRNI
jgi:hypothetical protein